ncbi:MAG: hypothetical protein AAFW67_13560, partial [Cyanobacteria bacterium J06638_38]
MAAKDFKIDQSTGDVVIKNGDFVLHESTNQHIEHILLAKQGDFKQWPLVGVGIRRYLKGPDSALDRRDLERVIRVNLLLDDMDINTVRVSSFENIQIN